MARRTVVGGPIASSLSAAEINADHIVIKTKEPCSDLFKSLPGIEHCGAYQPET